MPRFFWNHLSITYREKVAFEAMTGFSVVFQESHSFVVLPKELSD